MSNLDSMAPSTEYEGEGCVNLKLNSEGKLIVKSLTKEEDVDVSSRFGCSTHNCRCRKSKTGLVFYPTHITHKNVVLLVCERCYGYKSGGKTQHQQLADWYFGIYGKSKSFAFVSGFSQKENGELGFNSSSMNCGESHYHTKDRAMGELEQKIVRKVVRDKLESHVFDNNSNGSVKKKTETEHHLYLFSLD